MQFASVRSLARDERPLEVRLFDSSQRVSWLCMMKTTINIAVVAFAFSGLLGCGTDEAGASEISEAEARSKASAVATNAKISAVRKLDEADEHRWQVDAIMPNGAPLTIEIERASGELAEITGELGPFDYELPAPAAGLLTYGEAKAKALGAKAGGVEFWEVKPPEHEYEFYVREAATSLLWEVKMDATSGTVTSTEPKDRPD